MTFLPENGSAQKKLSTVYLAKSVNISYLYSASQHEDRLRLAEKNASGLAFSLGLHYLCIINQHTSALWTTPTSSPLSCTAEPSCTSLPNNFPDLTYGG